MATGCAEALGGTPSFAGPPQITHAHAYELVRETTRISIREGHGPFVISSAPAGLKGITTTNFVNGVCAGDAELCNEAVAHLVASSSARDFLERLQGAQFTIVGETTLASE